MNATTNVLPLPGQSKGALTEILRQGAHEVLAKAVEAEVAAYIAQFSNERDEEGRRW